MTRGKCCRARESNLRRHQAAPGLRYALNHIVTAHPNPTLDAERIGSYFDSLWYDPAGDRTPASQSQGGRSNHKATELVTVNDYAKMFKMVIQT